MHKSVLSETAIPCSSNFSQAYLDEKSIPMSRLVGLGGDKTSVMTGRHSGVASRIKNKQPIVTSIHCVAYRLALAASQAGERVKFVQDTFNTAAVILLL